MEKKSILLVAYSLNPEWGSEPGFASHWLETISPYFDVHVIADELSRPAIERKGFQNCTFHFIQDTEKWRRLGNQFGVPNFATKLFFTRAKSKIAELDLETFSLIHCITPAGIHSHNDIYKLGIPVVIGPLGGALLTPTGFSEAFEGQAFRTFLRDAFYRIYLKHSPGLRKYLQNAEKIVLGLSLEPQMLPRGLESKCVRIPDAMVNTAYFCPRDYPQIEDRPLILFAGRLTGSKGPLLLLKATELCLKRGLGEFAVEFAGEGPQRQLLEEYALEHDLGNTVSFLGGISKSKLREKYRTADIFCLPTLREPGGIAILEAMASGLPIVTTNYGGPANTVSDDCGIRIQLTNYQQYIEDLSDALTVLLLNPEMRIKLGHGARERSISEYSQKGLARKIVALYDDVCT